MSRIISVVGFTIAAAGLMLPVSAFSQAHDAHGHNRELYGSCDTTVEWPA